MRNVDQKLAWLIIGLVIFAVVGFIGYTIVNKTDGEKFKLEYEKENTSLYDDGSRYIEMDIPKKNPFVYLTYEEAVDFIKSGTGILFFSRPGCPYCRSTIPATIEFAKNNDIKEIYYYNPEAIRNANNEEYKTLLSLLDEYLPVDIVTQSKDASDFNPKLKRLVVPHLFFINKGAVVAHHQENRSTHNKPLSQQQHDEMVTIYNGLYKQLLTARNTCTAVKEPNC